MPLQPDQLTAPLFGIVMALVLSAPAQAAFILYSDFPSFEAMSGFLLDEGFESAGENYAQQRS